MAQEVISYELDVRSTLAALNTLNQGLTDSEGKLTGHNQKLSDAFAKVSNDLVKFSDKATQSQERFIKSLERQADLAGKSGTEKLIADRDRLTKKYGENEAAVNRITAAYQKMIAAEKGGSENGLAKFGENIKQFVENPLQAAGAGATGLLEKIGPVGIGLASFATAALAVGAALFEITKGFAESSEQMVNLSAASGISINNLDRLGAMAKIVGTDISTLSRASVSMAETLENGGAKANALQATLARLQVSTVDLSGSQRNEGDILVDVLGKLSKVTDEHTKLAIAAEVFGARQAKAMLPVIENYDKLDATVRHLGFGSMEEIVKQGDEAAQSLNTLSLGFDLVERAVGIGVLKMADWVGEIVKLNPEVQALIALFDKFGAQQDKNRQDAEDLKNGVWGKAVGEALSPLTGGSRISGQILAARSKFDQPDEKSLDEDKSKLEAELKKAQDIKTQALQGNVSLAGTQNALNNISKIKTEIAAIDTQLANIKAGKELINQQKELLKQLHNETLSAGDAELSQEDRIIHKHDETLAKLKELHITGKALAQGTADANLIEQRDLDALNTKLDKQLAKDLQSKNLAFERAALHQQLSAVPEVPLRELGKGVSGSDIEGDIQARHDKKLSDITSEFNLELQQTGKVTDERDRQRAITDIVYKMIHDNADVEIEKTKEILSLRTKQADQFKAFQEAQSKVLTQEQTDAVKANAATQIKLSQLAHREDPFGTIQDESRIKTEEAQQLYKIEVDRINREEEGYTQQLSLERALREEKKTTAQAEEDATLKLAEIRQQQFETIKSESAKLYDVLFTNPSKFGKDLQSTVKGAFLKPVTEGLGGLTSKALSPLIYGADGQGGIAGATKGLFGGSEHLDPIKVTDLNTEATKANTTSLDNVSAYLAAMAGLPAPPVSTGGAPGGVGSISLSGSSGGSTTLLTTLLRQATPGLNLGTPGRTPNFSPSYYSSGLDSLPIGFDQNSLSNLGGGGSGITPDFTTTGTAYADRSSSVTGESGAGDYSTGGFASGGGSTPTGSLLRSVGGSSLTSVLKSVGIGGKSSSGSSGSGFGGILSGFKGTNWGSFSRADAGGTPGGDDGSPGTDSQTSDGGNTGAINGVNGVAGAALVAGGTSLAEAGLLGNNRGTTAGIFEGAIGGAAIGLKYGGPLGAGIGAAVGLGIGLGEKLAGVESPMNKAKRLIQQHYGIKVSSAFAQSIVKIANDKYQTNVEMAVLSPEVRQSLQLYASGTGQKVPLSNTTPHAANLVESNGQLSQAATYQFGQAYAYSSSLPIDGGVNATTLPNPAQPTSIQLSVNGGGAGAFLAGQVVTPDFVQAQYASSQNSSNGRVANSALLQQPGLYSYGT